VKFFFRVLQAGILYSVFGVAAVLAQTTTPSVLSGAYTEEQALAGQSLYYQQCLVCHGEMMSGRDQAPPLTGPQFSAVWNDESLWALVERIGTMPPEKPGSLSRSERVDLLTYLLWFNGLPIGSVPLETEQSTLTKIKFQTLPPGQ